MMLEIAVESAAAMSRLEISAFDVNIGKSDFSATSLRSSHTLTNALGIWIITHPATGWL